MTAKDTVINEVGTTDDMTLLPPDYISNREHHNLMVKQAELTWLARGKADKEALRGAAAYGNAENYRVRALQAIESLDKEVKK